MRRMICGALCLAALTMGAAAYQVPYANGSFHAIIQPLNNNNPEDQAEMLKKLGLFLGTDQGFELERAMTRAEAAAMLFRFLGGAQQGGGETYSHPFTDVPAWAADAVGWLYQQQLTYGVSDTKYGAEQPVTADQYAAFLSRALAGNDNFTNRMLSNSEKEYFTGNQEPFERQHAVAMSVRALGTTAGPDQPSLAQQLVDKGVFTVPQFADAAWNVIAPEYQDARLLLAGVLCVDRSEDGFLNTSVTSSPDCALPYLYATREENGQTVYYQLDCRTLRETSLGTLGAANTSLQYVLTSGGTDYLWESVPQPDHHGKNRLLAVMDGQISVVLDEQAAEGAETVVNEGAESAVIRTLNGAYLLDAGGLHRDEEGARETVWTDGTYRVTQEVTAEHTTISLLRSATGEVVQTYTVPQDRADAPRKLTEQKSAAGEAILYGEAGLYGIYTGAGTGSGRLVQFTSEPVLNYTAADRLGNVLYAVSHNPGERGAGHSGMSGTKIIGVPFNMIDFSAEPSADRPVQVIVDSKLGIAPVRITALMEYAFFDIETENNVGMGYEGYTYRYSEFDHRLTVTDYTNTYAQDLNEWVESDPEAYKKPYIEKEQARIDAIQGTP